MRCNQASYDQFDANRQVDDVLIELCEQYPIDTEITLRDKAGIKRLDQAICSRGSRMLVTTPCGMVVDTDDIEAEIRQNGICRLTVWATVARDVTLVRCQVM